MYQKIVPKHDASTRLPQNRPKIHAKMAPETDASSHLDFHPFLAPPRIIKTYVSHRRGRSNHDFADPIFHSISKWAPA